MSISAGQPVPDFTATATGDTQLTLSQLRGKQVVIYFYPKASTPAARPRAVTSGTTRRHSTPPTRSSSVSPGTASVPRKTSRPSRTSTSR